MQASEKNLATNKLSAVQYAKEMEAAADVKGKDLAKQKLDKATEQEKEIINQIEMAKDVSNISHNV